jgi:hypothetical protein
MDILPIVIVVPHRQSKAEATRRLKTAIADAQIREAAKFKITEEKWDGNRLSFRIVLLGLPCTGTIDVGDDSAKAEVKLSWYQSHLTKSAEIFIQQRGLQILSGSSEPAS